ncbi:MAG: hypothetical protein ACP5QE_07125 [Conexivisphaera sp.]|jgi:hypothetical protein
MCGSNSKVWLLAGVISAAIIIAILSIPEVLEPLAGAIIKSMGPYWLLAVLIVGVVHGLKPDEHTWPITVSYGLMQRNARGVLAAISVFAGALTLVWTLMSALMGQLMGLLDISILGPYVDVIVGATMIGVAAYLVFGDHDKSPEEKGTADYRLIWIHGLAAAFGGDFFIVLILTAALVPAISPGLSFLIGFMFGAGSWVAQTVIVMAIYRGIIRSVGDWSVMASAGRMALGILGLFMIGLGIYSFLVPGAS